MKTEIMESVSRSIHKIGFKFKKHSPEILIVVGTIGAVTSAVMACKATLKVNDVIDEAKETVDKIHDSVEAEKHTADGELYTQEEANKDLALVYIQTGWKFVKLYGPAVALGAVSLGCMIGSNRILQKRNVALAAAFTAADTSFKEYRNRLIERFGENGKALDRELRYNIKAQEIEETVVDENGEETVVKQTVEVVDPNVAHDIYSAIYCEGCTGWCKDASLNKYFLMQQQKYANDKLRLTGFVSLNEVYDMLGLPRTSFGQLAGWVYTEDSSIGDNYVSFGLFDELDDERKCAFVNGYERSVILDFNCIGDAFKYA